jgi:organic radical activating enzyme
MAAYLSEVFTSIQGEGADVGTPAVFLRFAGCNLECSYCDTPASRQRCPVFQVRGPAGLEEMANPVACADLLRIVERMGGPMRLAVLTGGEPLLQPAAVAYLGPRLRAMGLTVQLETNGTVPEALREIEGAVDLVAMDLKLPSSQAGEDLSSIHEEFLRSAGPGRVVVKIIIPGDAPDSEVLAGVHLVARIDRETPVFLQPVFDGSRPQVDGPRLLHLLGEAAGLVRDVRLSVQMHKVIGVR